METPDEDAFARWLDALYAERDDAVDEGDLDRVHPLQAAITETIQQASMGAGAQVPRAVIRGPATDSAAAL